VGELGALAIIACTSGWPISPIRPIEAERSPGPRNSASTPSTAAISAVRSMAVGVSSCSTTAIASPAVFR